MLSPLAWKALVDTGGGNVVAGLRNAVSDLSKAPRVPSMVDPDAFEVGGGRAFIHADALREAGVSTWGAVRRRRRGQGHLRRLSQPRWAAWFATEPAQRHTPRVFAVCRWAGSAHRCRMPPAGRRTHDQVKVDPPHRWIVG